MSTHKSTDFHHPPQAGGHGRPGAVPYGPVLALVFLLCLLLPLHAGCGLLFGQDADAPRPASLTKDEESTAIPLPYDVEFVAVFDDGSRDSSSALADRRAKADAEARARGEDPEEAAREAEKEAAAQKKADAASDGDLADLAGVPDSPQGSATAAEKSSAPTKRDFSDVVAGMEKLSQLVALKDTPPDGALGLELRAKKDVDTALQYLASLGYYDGKVDMHIEGAETQKAKVTITMRTGKRYVIGDISILYTPEPKILPELAKDKDRIFASSWLRRIRKGQPSTASEILDSVQRITTRLHNYGYPDAKIVEEFYYLDKKKHTLNILVEVNPGEPAYMGLPNFVGKSDVNRSYLTRIVHWDPGTPWDARKLDRYLSHLRRTGLFHTVDVVDQKEAVAADGHRPMTIAVEDAKHRSVGAMLRYDTDTGLGAELHWEHRNLFGNGEKLSAEASYTSQERGIELEFLKPAFLRRGQILRANVDALDETTDAYERTGVMARTGIMRFWNRNWMTVTGIMADTGELKDTTHSRQPYTIYGLDLRVRRDTRDNRMNPTTGLDTELKLTPMAGRYSGDFTALGGEFDIAGYWAPFKRRSGRPSDKLVFAGRAGLGAISGASLANLPSPYRFYLGGIDSVRGYGYQQIGPKDKNGDPTGGRSYQTLNLETRYKLTDSLGLVAFLDGGQLYTSEFPEFDTDMDWGTGLGVRYFSPIGPVRMDVAFPIKKVNPPVQLYISIGQSF